MLRVSGPVAAMVAVVLAVSGLLVVASWQQQSTTCTTASPAIGADTSVPLPAGAAGAELTVRMGTWNVLKSNSTKRIVAGLTTMAAAGADVIAVQELQSYHRGPVARQLREVGWSMSDGNTATPVLWRADEYRLLAQGRVREFGVVRIEPGSAAGSSIGPKWIQWVQLQDTSTGAVFIAASHHLVPGIESKGRTDRHGPRRVAYAKKQILAAGQLAQQLGRNGQIPFLIGSDWNIDARKDAKIRTAGFPYATLPAFGLYSNWRVLGYPKSGTHGDRLIDGIFSTTRTVAPIRQQILNHYGSDHRAVLVHYTNRSRNRTTTAGSATVVAAQVGPMPATITVPSSTIGQSMTLDREQVANAAVIIAEGRKANIPTFGWVVAIATALQESGLRNLDHGDRDSQGLFQQRPSSGWGTVAQIRDPHLAAQAFYGVAAHTNNPGLVDIPDWQSMSVADAAQAVQVSAFPDAYVKWESTARDVVQQLSDQAGAQTGDGSCGTDQPAGLGECPATGLPVEKGLTPDALLVLRCVKARFPSLTNFGGVHPDPLPDHPSGRAVDIMIPNYRTTEGSAFGWQIAHWLQDNRQTLGVEYVIFDAKIWNIARDSEGWRSYSPGYTTTINDSSLHRNHVHVTVAGNAGNGLDTNNPNATTGSWTIPLPRGSYTVGCAFACYVSAAGLPHTGQDFPTPVGTIVRSSNTGTVTVSQDLNGSYGRYIVIRDTADPTITVYYAHLSERDVQVGQQITTGQMIGRSGSTGHSSGRHLHYEIRVDGNPVNPLPILAKHGVTP